MAGSIIGSQYTVTGPKWFVAIFGVYETERKKIQAKQKYGVKISKNKKTKLPATQWGYPNQLMKTSKQLRKHNYGYLHHLTSRTDTGKQKTLLANVSVVINIRRMPVRGKCGVGHPVGG